MQNKPNNWVTGFKRSPKSADTQVRAMGLFMNSLGYFEAIDTSYQKIHAEQGLYIDGDNKIFFRDFDNKDIYINSPSPDFLSINATNVGINTDDALGYVFRVNGTVNTGALTVSGNIIGTDITATADITANDALTVSGDSTLNQINQSGDRTLNSATVNDSIGGHQASFSFDGVDGLVSGPVNSIIPSASASIEAWFKTNQDSGTMTIAALGGSWSSSTLEFALYVSSGVLSVTNWRQSGSSTSYSTTRGVADGEWHHVVSTYVDGPSNTGVNKAYVDGVLVSTDSAVRTFGGTGASNTEIRIGSLEGWTSLYYFDGEISGVKYHNRTLSAAEVRAAYNGQAVPYEYVGAKDILSTDWNTNAHEGWNEGTGGNFTQDYTGGNMVLTATGTQSASHANIVAGSLVEGKKYRVKFTASANTQGTFQMLQTVPVEVYHTVVTGSNEFVFTAGSHEALYFKNSSGTTGDTITIDDFSIVQIGCVAEYLPSGINGNTDGTNPSWVDTSGNNLHGTTSTATAVNHKQGALTMVDNIVMANGKGIDFSATSDATGKTSEVLDDYEEGTWTPVMTDDTVTQAVASSACTYIKIGRLVYLSMNFTMGDLSGFTSSSMIKIQGIPFTSSSSTNYRAVGHIGYDNDMFNEHTTGAVMVKLMMTPSQDKIFFQDGGGQVDVGGGSLTVAAINASKSMQASIVYESNT